MFLSKIALVSYPKLSLTWLYAVYEVSEVCSNAQQLLIRRMPCEGEKDACWRINLIRKFCTFQRPLKSFKQAMKKTRVLGSLKIYNWCSSCSSDFFFITRAVWMHGGMFWECSGVQLEEVKLPVASFPRALFGKANTKSFGTVVSGSRWRLFLDILPVYCHQLFATKHRPFGSFACNFSQFCKSKKH